MHILDHPAFLPGFSLRQTKSDNPSRPAASLRPGRPGLAAQMKEAAT
jgi:hypothetical protein